MTGATFLGAPALDRLCMACYFLRAAFDSDPWLVGSTLERADYRDVDVRIVLSDERHRELFGTDHVAHSNVNPLRTLMCNLISDHLSRVTGLPVDFQIQQESHAKEVYKEKKRYPLALFIRGDEPV